MHEKALSSDDVVAITQAISAYAHDVDDGEGASFASLFTEDAVLDMGRTVVEGGRTALAEFADSVPGRVPGVRHVMSTVHVAPSPTGALARAYMETYKRNPAGDALELVQLGRYRFEFVRLDGGWAIRRVDLEAEPVG